MQYDKYKIYFTDRQNMIMKNNVINNYSNDKDF